MLHMATLENNRTAPLLFRLRLLHAGLGPCLEVARRRKKLDRHTKAQQRRMTPRWHGRLMAQLGNGIGGYIKLTRQRSEGNPLALHPDSKTLLS